MPTMRADAGRSACGPMCSLALFGRSAQLHGARSSARHSRGRGEEAAWRIGYSLGAAEHSAGAAVQVDRWAGAASPLRARSERRALAAGIGCLRPPTAPAEVAEMLRARRGIARAARVRSRAHAFNGVPMQASASSHRSTRSRSSRCRRSSPSYGVLEGLRFSAEPALSVSRSASPARPAAGPPLRLSRTRAACVGSTSSAWKDESATLAGLREHGLADRSCSTTTTTNG